METQSAIYKLNNVISVPGALTTNQNTDDFGKARDNFKRLFQHFKYF